MFHTVSFERFVGIVRSLKIRNPHLQRVNCGFLFSKRYNGNSAVALDTMRLLNRMTNASTTAKAV